MLALIVGLGTASAQSQNPNTTAKPEPTEALFAQASPLALPLGAPPLLRRTSEKPDGWTSEMETFLKKLIATYQQAESYRDRGRATHVQVTGRVKTTTEMPSELTFKRPNLLLLDAGQYQAGSDGKTVYFAVPGMGQYTAVKAPDKLEKKHLQAGTLLGGTDEGHPELIDFLIRADPYESLFEQIAKINWKPDASVNGQPCRVLHYETVQGTKLTTFIDPKRMVLLKVEAETPSTPPGANSTPPVASPAQGATTLIYEAFPVEINSKIETAAFAFKPAAGLRRVTQIGADTDPFGGPFQREPEPPKAEEVSPLTGKPAPEVRGKDLKGKSFAPDELRGKVALLFFWAVTGGDYCLLSIPTVQQVADHFKGRPEVMVLGINTDTEQPQTTAQLLERKKATFRNLVDEEMKLSRIFQLGGLPTFVLIGQDGIVKWAQLGAPPTLKQDLVGQIEKLLPSQAK